MKTFSKRELRLAGTVAGLVMAFFSYSVIQAQRITLESLQERRSRVEMDLEFQEEVMRMRPDWLRSLQRIRAQLPRHPPGRDIKSTLSRQVQSLMSASGLTRNDLTPEAEEYLENLDLHRTAIRCRWEGEPENLVEFLVRLQELGAVTDVRELRLRASERRGNLRVTGNFVLEFVYSREEAADDGTDTAEMETTP